MMKDTFYAPHRTARQRRPPNRPGELVWSIRRNGRQFDCELRYHGEHGVEVQLLRDREWFYGRILPAS